MLKKLINEHWAYIESVLQAHGVDPKEIDEARWGYKYGFNRGWSGKEGNVQLASPIGRFHYHMAYAHGIKHREEHERDQQIWRLMQAKITAQLTRTLEI